MSNDTKQSAPPSKDWMPVRTITFVSQMPIPGTSTATVLRGDVTQENVPRWAIHYSPAHRHFRVVFISPDKTKEPQTVMVPETSVKCWEPANG